MPTSKSADISESKLGTKSGIDKWAGVRHNDMHRFAVQIILMGITLHTPLPWKRTGLKMKCLQRHFSGNTRQKLLLCS
jgi:hypothetical protein